MSRPARAVSGGLKARNRKAQGQRVRERSPGFNTAKPLSRGLKGRHSPRSRRDEPND